MEKLNNRSEFSLIFKYALKDLSRNYHKISSIIVTLFISLFILSAIFTIEDSLKKELNDNAKALLGGDLEIDYNRNQGNLELVNQVKEFATVSQMIEFSTMLSTTGREKNKSLFTINGSEYNTHDGTCVRDYVHVVDICRAMIYAYENINEPGHRKYNLGTSKGHSNLEVTMRFQAMVGDGFGYQFGPNRKGDPACLVANGSKFIEETGFKYTHSNSLTMMINDTLQAHGVHVNAF